MEKILNNIEKQENKMEYGKNVEMIIDLIRHGEKDEEGNLTEKGKQEAKKLGDKIREEDPDSAGIKVYSSDIKRAKETGELIENEDNRFKQREKKALSITGKISEESIEKIKDLINSETGDESEAVQAIIDTDDKRMDEETISSKEISQDIAKQILMLIKMTKRLNENSKVNVVMTSHSGVIENFIVDAVKEKRKGFVDKIGGQVKYLESVRIKVIRQDKENVDINLNFRDYNLDITEEDLEEIINS